MNINSSPVIYILIAGLFVICVFGYCFRLGCGGCRFESKKDIDYVSIV